MTDPRPLKLDDLGGGTPCAKVDQEPRYVSILYPTDQPLTDEELTTWEREAVESKLEKRGRRIFRT